MTVKLKLPKFIEGKEISSCYECPFYDNGDDGYASHCNIIDEFIPNPETIWIEVRRKYNESNFKMDGMTIVFNDYCPLSHEEVSK